MGAAALSIGLTVELEGEADNSVISIDFEGLALLALFFRPHQMQYTIPTTSRTPPPTEPPIIAAVSAPEP